MTTLIIPCNFFFEDVFVQNQLGDARN